MTSEFDPVTRFYRAFEAFDAEAMAKCYHDEVWFADPAFGELRGEHARNMWRMLIESQKGKPFQVRAYDIHCDGKAGSATWEAHYQFGPKKRPVHNLIQAKFKIVDDKIVSHLDEFNLHRWATQAMGAPGWLIGWTAFFRAKLHRQTNDLLSRYEARTKA